MANEELKGASTRLSTHDNLLYNPVLKKVKYLSLILNQISNSPFISMTKKIKGNVTTQSEAICFNAINTCSGTLPIAKN